MFNPKYRFFSFLFIVLICIQCQDENNSGEVEDQVSNGYELIQYPEEFSIQLPDYFKEMNDVNPAAILQYGFIDKNDKENLLGDEVYVTVISHYKTEMRKKLDDTSLIKLIDFNTMSNVNLDLILEDFSVVVKNPKIELINGLSCIQNQFHGKLGQYPVYYQLAVFESENEFFQLLTWCMENHISAHKAEMNYMINSFEKL